jgi:hypothetical protein
LWSKPARTVGPAIKTRLLIANARIDQRKPARFSEWSPRVRAIVAATTADQLMRHDVYHLPAALAAFDKARRPRCRQLARMSVVIAKFGADLGGRRQTVRNTLMRLAPAKSLVKAGAPVVRWTAP